MKFQLETIRNVLEICNSTEEITLNPLKLCDRIHIAKYPFSWDVRLNPLTMMGLSIFTPLYFSTPLSPIFSL